MTKSVAESIKSLSASEVYARIMDPGDDLVDVVESVKNHWAYDLYARRPAPALVEDGVLKKPTDLDLACFVSALADRGAVINLPKYEPRRPRTHTVGERVVSVDNRHGRLVSLVSNKEVFSFSVKVIDANVVTTKSDGSEEAGAPRNFMLVDVDGNWYDGWKKIEFAPSRPENAFLSERGLWTGNTVVFENFVHPNRWTSLYGKWYLLTKILIQRLRIEASARRDEVKDKLLAGIKLPPSAGRGPTSSVGDYDQKRVNAFEAEVDVGVELPTSYPSYPNTVDGLVAANARAVRLTYTDVPALNFPCRATEYAFAQRADAFGTLASPGSTPALEPFPSWISGAKWERGFKIKKTSWNRLVLHQAVPFTRSLALRYRVWSKLEKVAA